jgi:hypothetical protein
MHDNNSVDFPEGSYCPLSRPYGSYNTQDDIKNDSIVVLSTSHHGLCLFVTELNCYDDSDFFMVVWDPVLKKTEKINFATTRAWTYPCYASTPDATPAVKSEYAEWKKYQERKEHVLAKRKARQKARIEATEMQISVQHYAKAVNSGCFELIYSLLKVKKFRSAFRESCAAQVREWLVSQDTKFSTPLSKRQRLALGFAQ